MSQGRAEVAIAPAGSVACPYAGTTQLSFNGDLTRGSRSDLPGLIAQLPTRAKLFDDQERTNAETLAGTWTGPASFWDSDHSPKPAAPNATLTLRLSRTSASSTERFSATGTVVLSRNETRDILLRNIVVREGTFTSEGFFSNDPEPWTHNQEHSYYTLGSFDGRLNDRHLIIDKGGVMYFNLLANLHRSPAQ
ncbi:MAG: hypothetical protein ACRYFU_22630 [Janthinobacterium lividum]